MHGQSRAGLRKRLLRCFLMGSWGQGDWSWQFACTFLSGARITLWPPSGDATEGCSPEEVGAGAGGGAVWEGGQEGIGVG